MKNNLSFVKNVPMTYVNCVIIVVTVSEKQYEALLLYGP